MNKITILLFILIIMINFSCQKQSETLTGNEPPKLDFTIDDFNREKDFMEEGMLKKTMMNNNTPDNAIVPLIFDENGLLYTPEKYEKLKFAKLDMRSKLSTPSPKIYYTHLKTFQKITRFYYANTDYVLAMPGSNGDTYVLDPYRKKQLSKAQRANLILQKKLVSNHEDKQAKYAASTLRQTDIIIGEWSSGNWFGHSCIVYNAPVYDGTLTNLINNTTTYDSWDENSGVITKNMATYFLNKVCQERIRCRLNGGLTSSQKAGIISFLEKQKGKPYEITGDLYDDSRWYCSKLVWRAYWDNTQTDIASLAAYYVTPDDIQIDGNLSNYYLDFESNPGIGVFANNSGNINSNYGVDVGGTVRMKVTKVNDLYATFNFEKNNGSSFSESGTFYIKENDQNGNIVDQRFYNVHSWGSTLTIKLKGSGGTYYGMVKTEKGSRFQCGKISFN